MWGINLGWHSILLIAALFIVALLIIYWTPARKTGRRERHSSNGTWDEAAIKAYSEARQSSAADAAFDRANLLRYNLHENGNLRLIPAQHAIQIARDYREAAERIGEGDHTEQPATHILAQMAHLLDIQTDFGQEDELVRALRNLTNTVNIVRPAVEAADIDANLQEARETTNNPREAAAKYADHAVMISNDPQNVHDSYVVADLAQTAKKLQNTASNRPSAEIYAELAKYIDDHAENNKREMAHCGLNVVIGKNAHISAYDAHEGDILRWVWDRANLPANRQNQQYMRDAVVDALADCVPGGNSVCVSGRAARLMGSLATLDCDDTMGSAHTLEAYKAQLLAESNNILETRLAAAELDTTNTMSQGVVAYYNGDTDANISPEDLANWQSDTAAAISAHVESYSDKIAPDDLKIIKAGCVASATA